MKTYLIILACVAISVAKQSSESSESISSSFEDHYLYFNPIVATQRGIVKGTTQVTLEGDLIYSFVGMRYVEPPVGELRFQPPVPVKAWRGEYNATMVRPACPQPANFPTDEDCLFINVYSPKLPKNTRKRYPVIVYVHPGNLNSLSGNNDLVGPHYLLDRDVVLVTFNYRLGALGFLSTGDKFSPGNNGMKDQVEALRWVKNNIEAFGGNPNYVTLAGYGISAHLLSPMSKGLFHRAIIMGDSVFGNQIVKNNQLDLAKKQAHLLGCSTEIEKMIQCFKSVPARVFGDTLEELRVFKNDPQLLWQFVVEPDFGQERFLTENPLITLQKGLVADVPVMTGITYDELISLAYPIVTNQTALEIYNRDMYKIFPYAFNYGSNLTNSDTITTELKNFYFQNGTVNENSIEPLGKLYSDVLSGFGINRGARLLSQYLRHNVYYYVFTYKGYHSNFPQPNGSKTYVVRLDDQMYVFWNSMAFPKFHKRYPEAIMVKKLTKLYAHFAYFGNPTPIRSRKLDNVLWVPHNSKNRQYLEIGDRLQMKSDIFSERYAKLDSLFPLPAV